MNDAPNTQRKISGLKLAVIHAPSAPANPWLTTVAHKMPAMMGSGFLNRAASKKASNWVLSPISAKATMPVEINKASTRAFEVLNQDALWPHNRTRPTRRQGHGVRRLHRRVEHRLIVVPRRDARVGFVAMVGHRTIDYAFEQVGGHAQRPQTGGQA